MEPTEKPEQKQSPTQTEEEKYAGVMPLDPKAAMRKTAEVAAIHEIQDKIETATQTGTANKLEQDMSKRSPEDPHA